MAAKPPGTIIGGPIAGTTPKAPYVPNKLHIPLTGIERSRMITWLIAYGKGNRAYLQGLNDNQLLEVYTGAYVMSQNPLDVPPGAPHIPNPIASVTDFLNMVWGVVSNHEFWIRALEFVAGLGLIFVAVKRFIEPGTSVNVKLAGKSVKLA